MEQPIYVRNNILNHIEVKGGFNPQAVDRLYDALQKMGVTENPLLAIGRVTFAGEENLRLLSLPPTEMKRGKTVEIYLRYDPEVLAVLNLLAGELRQPPVLSQEENGSYSPNTALATLRISQVTFKMLSNCGKKEIRHRFLKKNRRRIMPQLQAQNDRLLSLLSLASKVAQPLQLAA